MALTCPALDCHARCRRRWTVTHPLLPAAPAGVPQYSILGLLANACL